MDEDWEDTVWRSYVGILLKNDNKHLDQQQH